MSNDTTVHLILYSSDYMELACSLAYLRNKDKTWGLECEEIKYNNFYGYFYRVYGWANENSWNYKITGEGGEIDDLLRRFPNLEITSHYRDEYSAGELNLYQKDYGDKEEDLPMFSFTLIFPSLGKAKGWQNKDGEVHKGCDSLGWFLLDRAIPFCCDGSVGFDGNQVKLELSCDVDDSPKEELWLEVIEFLKRLKAPKDTELQEHCYYHGHIFQEEKLWGEEAKNPSLVSSREVLDFLNAVDQDQNRSPWEMLDNLGDFTEKDLGYLDEGGNNLFHCAALGGRFKEIPESELHAERMLVKNYEGRSVIDLLTESGKTEELPESMRVNNFEELYRQSENVQKLISNGYQSVVEEILKNFPNPLV